VDIETTTQRIKKASPWLISWGIVVFVCGILAMILPTTFSVAISVIIGCLVLVAGIGHFVFAFHTRSAGGFLWQILIGILYLIAAICLLVNPLLGVLSLTLFLAIFLLLEGVFELALYVRLREFRHSLWLLFDGIGTVALGIVMFRQWPPASPEVIGTLVGISMMLSAGSRLVLLLGIRALGPAPA
jgi:uncharacterized membrane protein HdeD (DUF308 family)